MYRRACGAGRDTCPIPTASAARRPGEGAVTRTGFGGSQFGSPSFGSRRGGGSPRLERFVSEDAKRAAGCQMALDVENVLCCSLVAPSLHEQVENLAFVV